MTYSNVIVYLIGFAGVGKRTIAREICRQADFRLIDNHTINNVVFPFVHNDTKTKLPPEIWQRTEQVRKIALDTMVDLGNREFSYVFTNQLREDDPEDARIYNSIFDAAKKMEACFVPVRLVCDADEHRKRIVSEERAALYKTQKLSLVDDAQSETVFMPDHPALLTLDVTALQAERSAQKILEHIARMQGR